jgi:hypothetical protein
MPSDWARASTASLTRIRTPTTVTSCGEFGTVAGGLHRVRGLRELHDDAEGLFGMQERGLRVVVRVVVADDVLDTRARPFARLLEARHLERHVMDAPRDRRPRIATC